MTGSVWRPLGPKLADVIVAEFGEQAMHVMEETPQRLLEVHQIGASRYSRIIGAWRLHQDIREFTLFLRGWPRSAGCAALRR